MKDKQFDPARYNEQSPAPGLAAVNTHNHEEEEPAGVPGWTKNMNPRDQHRYLCSVIGNCAPA